MANGLWCKLAGASADDALHGIRSSESYFKLDSHHHTELYGNNSPGAACPGYQPDPQILRNQKSISQNPKL